jgi:hypothetical protein
MPKNVKKQGVHMVYKEGVPVAFFMRDEAKSNENVFFILQKASLEDLEDLLNSITLEEKLK